ncbi:4-diphosphocytidyl-2-C-methyl-D-erythritol kinase [Candidatus Hepatincolaceae symbiont of Richtersius coronifer]
MVRDYCKRASLQVSYKAKAKINLFLKVLDKLPNNYHDLQSLVAFAEVYDYLEFSYSDINIMESSGRFANLLPKDNSNLIFKVLSYFQEFFLIKQNVKIYLTKNLPIGGGIGGGSSDCAMTILALNKLFKLNLTFTDLLKIAIKFGADVPMCLYQIHQQQALFIQGVGEKIQPFNLIRKFPILLITPLQPVSTGLCFNKFDELKNKILNSDKFNSTMPTSFIEPIKYSDIPYNEDLFLDFINLQSNDLTASACFFVPVIKEILDQLAATKPLVHKMSGSGSTCFAIYNNLDQAQQAFLALKKIFPGFYKVVSQLN